MGFRLFNGRRYRLYDTYGSAPSAQQAAESVRRQGHNARIVTMASKWRLMFAVFVSVDPAKTKKATAKRTVKSTTKPRTRKSRSTSVYNTSVGDMKFGIV